MHLLFMGTRLAKDEDAKLAIIGDSLGKSCSPNSMGIGQTSCGVKSVAGDDSEFSNSNCESRCLVYLDEDLNAPASYPSSGLPTGRKTP